MWSEAVVGQVKAFGLNCFTIKQSIHARIYLNNFGESYFHIFCVITTF